MPCIMGLAGGSDGKESACNAGNQGSIPDSWVGKIPWRREWLHTPVIQNHKQMISP